jgi:hypothetical protein
LLAGSQDGADLGAQPATLRVAWVESRWPLVTPPVERPKDDFVGRHRGRDASVDLELFFLRRRFSTVETQELGAIEADAFSAVFFRQGELARQLHVGRHGDGGAVFRDGASGRLSIQKGEKSGSPSFRLLSFLTGSTDDHVAGEAVDDDIELILDLRGKRADAHDRRHAHRARENRRMTRPRPDFRHQTYGGQTQHAHGVSRCEVMRDQDYGLFSVGLGTALAAKVAKQMFLDVIDVTCSFSEIRRPISKQRALQPLGNTSNGPFGIDALLLHRITNRVDQKRVGMHEQVHVKNGSVRRPVLLRQLVFGCLDLGA